MEGKEQGLSPPLFLRDLCAGDGDGDGAVSRPAPGQRAGCGRLTGTLWAYQHLEVLRLR